MPGVRAFVPFEGLQGIAGLGTVTQVNTAGLATGGPIVTTGSINVPIASAAQVAAGTDNTVAVTPAGLQGTSAPGFLMFGSFM